MVITELRKGKYLYEKDLAAKIKTDNKLFWGYVRSKSKTKSTVNKLMNEEGKVSESNHKTACILNKFFASVFEKEGDDELPEFAERNYSQPLESLLFTEEQVSKAIDHIKASKSQGPDNIHPKLIKETKSAIKKPLKILFTKSLEEEKSQQFGKKPM